MTRPLFLPSLLDRLLDRRGPSAAEPGRSAPPQPAAAASTAPATGAPASSAPATGAAALGAPVRSEDREGARGRRRADDRRLYSHQELRNSVLEDLKCLLNTGNLESAQSLAAYPYVARSTLNYGIPDLTGWTASAISVAPLEKAMLEAIRQFEPRIIADSLRVRAIRSTDEMSSNTLSFEISGLLWGRPAPTSMLLRTEFDLESGHVHIKEFSA